jgi:hypothetical protein
VKRWQVTTTNLRPTTRDLYGYLLRRFLLPTFGKRSLSSIDVLAVRSWLASLEGQGMSASTRAKRTGCCPASSGRPWRPGLAPQSVHGQGGWS